MGNIRPTYIKRVAIELVEKYNDRFTDDFEKNKAVVDELTDVKTTLFRNRIAGYVTSYRKNWEAATVEADEEETPATAQADAPAAEAEDATDAEAASEADDAGEADEEAETAPAKEATDEDGSKDDEAGEKEPAAAS